MPANLKSINAVEIFSAGTWNGDQYTEQDLDEMVRAFRATKENWTPALKLGHDDDQKILQKDGLPAAGWIENIYRVGSKLLADFSHIPEKIAFLLETKAYKRVSSEIYWNITVNGTRFPYLVGAVALLGADLPGVQNLNDIIALYGLDPSAKIKIFAGGNSEAIVKRYDFPDRHSSEDLMPQKTENEIKLEVELQNTQAKTQELEGEVKTFKSQLTEKDAELEKLRKDNEEKSKLIADKEAEAARVARESYADKLVAEKVATPAMKPYILELMGEEKKEYSFKAGTEDKKLSKQDLIAELLKLHTAVDVNTQERSKTGQKSEGSKEDQIEKAIEDYMTENKCDYKTAYKAVARLHKLDAKPIQTMVAADE